MTEEKRSWKFAKAYLRKLKSLEKYYLKRANEEPDETRLRVFQQLSGLMVIEQEAVIDDVVDLGGFREEALSWIGMKPK